MSVTYGKQNRRSCSGGQGPERAQGIGTWVGTRNRRRTTTEGEKNAVVKYPGRVKSDDWRHDQVHERGGGVGSSLKGLE